MSESEPTDERPANAGAGTDTNEKRNATTDTDTGTDGTEGTSKEETATATDDRGARSAAETAQMDAAESLLAVRDLDAGYGDLRILYDVFLDVADGEYVTIVGPNGAGKSTVMKSVFGLTTYMGGSITFAGTDITGRSPEDIIHRGIGYVPQNDNVFTSLSVAENLAMGAYILEDVPEEALREVYERFPILDERREQKAGTMSGGQRQMLAMGRALMLEPDLLLLDEPSAGLAPDLVEEMFDKIDEINEAGTAILMVEQNAKEALRRCDRGYVFVQGHNRFVDSGQALLEDEEVRQEFLGG